MAKRAAKKTSKVVEEAIKEGTVPSECSDRTTETESQCRHRTSSTTTSSGTVSEKMGNFCSSNGESEKSSLECRPTIQNRLRRVHQAEESLLASSSGFENYRGVLNLCILLLLLSNFKNALSNAVKYGLLVNPAALLFFLEDPYSWPCTSTFVCSLVFIEASWLLEVLANQRSIPDKTLLLLHTLNQLCLLIFPSIVVIKFNPSPVFATLLLMWYTIVWMKLISYLMVNKWLREGHGYPYHSAQPLSSEVGSTEPESMVKYPDNLTHKDLYYFMVVPTLCYELNFPRLPHVRKTFLARRVFEFIFLAGFIIAGSQQWIVPAVESSHLPFKELSYLEIVERIMTLAIPNHFLWLMFFYAGFHSWLNIIGELTCFADRCFYRDWWNSTTVQQFWQNWNIPVHRWAHRHVYSPLLRGGYSKTQGLISVFLLSAFFHEYLVSIPLRMLRYWAFTAMLMQIPFAILVSKLKNRTWGNIAVWLSLIVGQPVAIFMYYHDYYIIHSPGPPSGP